mmetsp:Transcript_104915/g.302797  ORF Transcript_104915/g.302797 Transcript_104915/m.302797 type:complete len:363 (+) Transcript_104915:2140-3228(+)
MNLYLSCPGSSTCNACVRDYFMDLDGRCQICTSLCDGSDTNGINAASKTQCADCSQVGSVLTTLKVQSGWWRANEMSMHIYRCANGNCKGGNSTCREGSNGPACSYCRGGFYQSQKAAEDNGGFHCADCAKRQLSAMTIAMLAFAMTATIMLLFFFKKHKKQFLRWTHNNRIALNTLGDTITVLWVTMQTLVLVVQNHKEAGGKNMPSNYDRFLSFFSFVSIDLLGTIPGAGCVIQPNFFQSLVCMTLFCIACALVAVALHTVKQRQKDPDAWKILKRVVWLSKILLPPVSLAISKAFRCKNYDDVTDNGINVLLADHTITCEGDTYNAMLAYASLMAIIFPVSPYTPCTLPYTYTCTATKE